MHDLQHNIVNILYTVKGMIESHLASIEEGHFRKEKDILKRSEEVLRKAYSQADQVLAITKRLGFLLESDEKVSNCHRKVSVRRAWDETVRILRKEFSFSKIEIIERIPDHFPPVQCQRDALKEIFYHLAKNAIQAMKGEGKLIIRIQLAFSTKEDPYAVMTLADTGPGIPGAKLPYLFQPFFTTKSRREGNGLGLYLTKALVTKNQGRITVSSFEGFGSTFTLEFPMVQSCSSNSGDIT